MRQRLGNRPIRRTVSLSVAVIAALTGVAACSSNGSGGSRASVTLGYITPLSGVSASIAGEAQKAVDAAIAKYSGTSATGGAKIVYKYRDNPGDVATGVAALESLKSIYHIPGAMTTKSVVIAAQKKIAEQSHIVLQNAAASDPGFRGLSPYIFTTAPLGDTQMDTVVKYAVAHGLKKIAVISSTESYGQAMKKIAPGDIAKLGGTYVGGASADLTDTNFGTVVSQLQNLHPDAVFQAFLGSGAGALMKQAAQVGFNPVWLQTTNIDNPAALRTAGPAANGMISTQVVLPHSTEADAYLAKMKSSGVSDPSSLDDLAYAEVQIYAQAIGIVLKSGKDVNGQNLRAAMVNHKFDTIYGPLTYFPNGLSNLEVTVTKYTDGKFVPVTTP